MIYHLLDFVIGYRSVHRNAIPVLLVHMISWRNRRIILPEDDCPGRIAFDSDSQRIVDRHEREHFAHDLKDSGLFAKGKIFAGSMPRETIIPKFNTIHHHL